MPIISEATVNNRLRRWSYDDPDKPAFIFRGLLPGNQRLVLTRHDVYSLACCFCSLAREVGVGAGDMVCNTLPNSPERVVTDLGLMMMGAVSVNGMVFLDDGTDLERCLHRSGCVAIIVDPTRPGNALSVLGDRITVRGENAQSRKAQALRKVFNVDCGGGAALRPWLENLQKREEWHPGNPSPHETAVVFNCPSSRGFSRFVSRTHDQLISMGDVVYTLAEMGPKDVYFNNRPLGWYNGCCCVFLAKGTPRVLVDMTVAPKDQVGFAWDSCLAERCNVCLMLPPNIHTIFHRPALWKHRDTICVRNIVACGMPLSKQHVAAVGEMCDNIIITYSSAETGFVTKLRVSPQDKQDFEEGDFGPVIKGVKLKLLDKLGLVIPPRRVGVPGDLVVRGSQICSGYMWIAADETTGVSIEQGWLKTNDVAYYNARGHIHFVCHKYSAINHGSHVIYPEWLEERLSKCPGVQQLCIVPVPDPKMYQEMCVCVVPSRGVVLKDNDIRVFCESVFASKAVFKQIPKFYAFLQEIPMLDDTLVDRKQLFYTALHNFGL